MPSILAAMPAIVTKFGGRKAHLPKMESVDSAHPSLTDVVGFRLSHAPALGGMNSEGCAAVNTMVSIVGRR